METRGRRPLWKDYKDFRKAVDKYFEDCAQDPNVLPDYAGMLLALQIDKADAEYMQTPEWPDYEEFRRIFSIAKLRRESWIARRMAVDNKAANGCFNLLKQEENGGYSDRGALRTQEKKVAVKIEGINGGWDAFK